MSKSTRSRISRRHVLSTLGLASLAAGAPRMLRAAEQQDVIIIGAGLAGLNTAMLLEEQGFKVTLLEASNRVGGRIRTEFIDGVRYEHGASDIGVMYARALDLMQRLELKRIPTTIKIRPYCSTLR